jgi:gliding motility-associated-like protein
VFTPGSDVLNDFFQPFPFLFVESVEMKIYNRWGNLVFETDDPTILWDGTEMKQGKPSADGTYFYTCKVNERCLDGIKTRVLKGFITLFNNK